MNINKILLSLNYSFIIILLIYFKRDKYEYLYKEILSKKLLKHTCPEICNDKRAFYQENIILINCILHRLIINGNGGAIYIDSIPYNIFIESSNFYKCISTLQGGGIYFNIGKNVTILNTGAILCHSGVDQHGQFLYTNSDNFSSFNIFFLTISQCNNNLQNGFSSNCYDNGILNISNINCSNNFCIMESSIRINNLENFFIKFSTFFNNSCKNSQKNLNIMGINGIFDYCNFINLISLKGSIFYCEHSIINITNSIFNRNHGILFYSNSTNKGIFVLNCIMFHPEYVNYELSLEDQWPPEYAFVSYSPHFDFKQTPTWVLYHFNTHYEINNINIECLGQNPGTYFTQLPVEKTLIYNSTEKYYKNSQVFNYIFIYFSILFFIVISISSLFYFKYFKKVVESSDDNDQNHNITRMNLIN